MCAATEVDRCLDVINDVYQTIKTNEYGFKRKIADHDHISGFYNYMSEVKRL